MLTVIQSHFLERAGIDADDVKRGYVEAFIALTNTEDPECFDPLEFCGQAFQRQLMAGESPQHPPPIS